MCEQKCLTVLGFIQVPLSFCFCSCCCLIFARTLSRKMLYLDVFVIGIEAPSWSNLPTPPLSRAVCKLDPGGDDVRA